MGHSAKKFSFVRVWDGVGSQVLKWESTHDTGRCNSLKVRDDFCNRNPKNGESARVPVPEERASASLGQRGRKAKNLPAPLVILPELRDIPNIDNFILFYFF